mgnify:CR=1 FL=1
MISAVLPTLAVAATQLATPSVATATTSCAPKPLAPANRCGDFARTGHARRDLAALVRGCGPGLPVTPVEERPGQQQQDEPQVTEPGQQAWSQGPSVLPSDSLLQDWPPLPALHPSARPQASQH